MQRKKSRLDVYQQTYLNKADIMKLLVLSRAPAYRIYDIADQIDAEELGKYRIEPYKVRLKTVLKVTHTDPGLLLRQIKSDGQ